MVFPAPPVACSDPHSLMLQAIGPDWSGTSNRGAISQRKRLYFSVLGGCAILVPGVNYTVQTLPGNVRCGSTGDIAMPIQGPLLTAGDGLASRQRQIGRVSINQFAASNASAGSIMLSAVIPSNPNGSLVRYQAHHHARGFRLGRHRPARCILQQYIKQSVWAHNHIARTTKLIPEDFLMRDLVTINFVAK